jgi:hypothetical protein
VEQLGELALEEPLHGDAAPASDDLGDVLLVHLLLEELQILLDGGERRRVVVELLLDLGHVAVTDARDALEIPRALRLLLLVLQRLQTRASFVDLLDRGLLAPPVLGEPFQLRLGLRDLLFDERASGLRAVVLLPLQREALDLELLPAALEHVDLARHAVHLDPQPRRRLVHEIDRLVGKLPVGEIAVRQDRGRDERRVLDLHLVEVLVALAEPAEDRDRLLHGRLRHEHRLEAPLERGVLLDALPVLVERRRADAVELAPRERGLQEVRRVERALGRTRAHEGVELVDEQDHLSFGPLHFLEHRLEPLLELPAVLRAGEERPQIEGQHAPRLEPLGHVAAHDALREPFGDGGLPHARLADQDRVVLRAPREHLDHAADLVVAADDRIERALARGFGQVARVLGEGLIGLFGIGSRHLFSSAHAQERVIDVFTGRPRLAQDASHLGRDGGIERAEQEVLGAHVLVA